MEYRRFLLKLQILMWFAVGLVTHKTVLPSQRGSSINQCSALRGPWALTDVGDATPEVLLSQQYVYEPDAIFLTYVPAGFVTLSK